MISMYLAIKVRIIDHADSFLRKHGKSFYYKSRYGIKVINRIGTESHKPVFEDPQEIDPYSLHLPFDFLKDEYSLLGLSICHSPHLELVLGCANGLSDENSYILRAQKGILDGRDSVYETVEKYMSHYEESLKCFNENKVEPIRFYVVDGKRFIADGKHRAAMAIHLGRRITGIEISADRILSGSVIKMLSMMNEQYDIYKRNIKHLNSLIQEGEKQKGMVYEDS